MALPGLVVRASLVLVGFWRVALILGSLSLAGTTDT